MAHPQYRYSPPGAHSLGSTALDIKIMFHEDITYRKYIKT